MLKKIKDPKYLIPIIILMSIVGVILLQSASAAVFMVSPSNATNWTATININCTRLVSDTPLNPTTARVYYRSTAGGTNTSLTTISNTTANDTMFDSDAVSISALSDTATYQFFCGFTNSSATGGQTNTSAVGNIGITIDNTNPVCTSTIQRTISTKSKPQQTTCSCTDGIDSGLTTTRSLTKPTNSVVTISATPYTLSGTDINELGSYTFGCYTSDYTGNYHSDNRSIRLSSDSTAPLPQEVQQSPTKAFNLPLIGIILGGFILLIMIFVIVFFAMK